MHLESVTACYGASVITACVIDIGSDSVKVSCVDEGVILPGTIVKKLFGGSDFNLMLYR